MVAFGLTYVPRVPLQKKFHEFDRDKSGDMNMYELRDALEGLGELAWLLGPISPISLIPD